LTYNNSPAIIGYMSKDSPANIGYVSREVEAELDRLLDLPQIIALVGPRRSGKTTLLKHYHGQLANALYMSFEDSDVLDLFNQDIKAFSQLYLESVDYLLIDEFHYSPVGGKNLKYIFDFFPGKKIVISGSSAADLTIQAIKYLVGRVVTVTLYPFSFSEFLQARDQDLHRLWSKHDFAQPTSQPITTKLKEYYQEYLLYGAYPEVVLQSNLQTKQDLLKGIYNTLFLREVKDLLSSADDYKLKALIKALGLQMGNLINYQELGQVSGLDYRTLKRYLGFLEKVYICQQMRPFYRNTRKELVKTPKIYFFDTGLVNAILDDFSPPLQRYSSGSLLENSFFSLLARDYELKYWRTRSQAETDFIIVREGRVVPIEVKLSGTSTAVSRSLHSFVNTYQPSQAIIATAGLWAEREVGNTKVLFRPVWECRRLLSRGMG